MSDFRRVVEHIIGSFGFPPLNNPKSLSQSLFYRAELVLTPSLHGNVAIGPGPTTKARKHPPISVHSNWINSCWEGAPHGP